MRLNANTEMTMTYPRNLVGYGANPPDARCPGEVQFVLNYEEGERIAFSTAMLPPRPFSPRSSAHSRCRACAI
jgi:hypothetical protein